MKFILAPDSFKGTMSSQLVCDTMKDAILELVPDAEVVSVPIADGGEGSVDAFLSTIGGEKISLSVTGPRFEKVESFYGILPDNTAVIEMAAAAGLPMMGDNLDVCGATTYGVGELMKDAIGRGCKNIILALGGSATNDGGCGAAAALGAKFYSNGKEFVPTGGTLSQIESIDLTELDKLMDGVTVTAMCDIDNPLCGEFGASAVFGPQKGANEEMIKVLDAGLYHLGRLLSNRCDILNLPGAGAAGGMGGGAKAFFGANLKMGIDVVLDECKFDEKLKGADLVLSGEGRIDSQSLRGKAVIGVAHRARRAGVPLISVVGAILDPIDDVYNEGVTAVFSINRRAEDFSVSKHNSVENLKNTVLNIIRTVTEFRK